MEKEGDQKSIISRIKKRDGKIVLFDQKRITNAIFKAAQAVGGTDREIAKRLSNQVVKILEERSGADIVPTVEQIQDIVEKVLIENGHAKTAKAYILYREQRKKVRDIKALLNSIEIIDNYVSQLDWRVKENSNMGYSLQGLNNHIATTIVSKYWLNKIYPEYIREAHENARMHIHDLGTLGAYTYFGKETVIAKLNGKILLASFQQLYDKIKEKEYCLSKKDGAWAKRPKNLLVLDKTGWTKATRLVKKAKKQKMHFVKNEGGRSVIVTPDHPMILTDEETKQAKDVKKKKDKTYTVNIKKLLKKENILSQKTLYIAEELYKKDIKDFWIEGMPFERYSKYSKDLQINGLVSVNNNANCLPNKINLNEDLGYLIGFYLAEGSMDPHRIQISQKLTKENEKIIERLEDAANQIGCRLYKREREGRIELTIVNTTFTKYLLTEIFESNGTSKEKSLPKEILNYNKEFITGIIAGVIDGDGSIESSKTGINVRIASRTLLEQLATMLTLIGFFPRDRNIEGVGSTREFKGKILIQNYPLFGVNFRTRKEIDLSSIKYKSAKTSTKAWRVEGEGWHKILNNDKTEIADRYIYDITTESTTLIVNGMWNHNCVGWDLRDLLLTGFKGVTGKTESKAPKHFRTALGQIVNFFYTLQGESAGAQAFSNFDTLLAPFIHYDRLNRKAIKQAMQEFIFNMNVPTRVGFQCLSEDTEILTVEGWKKYNEVKKGMLIKTFNIKKGLIEDKKVKSVFKKKYKGIMYNLKDSTQDQLISPKHRLVKKETKNKYSLMPVEKILKLKSFTTPQIKNKKLEIKNKKVDVKKIKKVNYLGIIWCPNTENETVVARRNGKVFITGNTPFTNITLDLKVPEFMKDENVIVGGKLMAKKYKDFQEEMDWINDIFAEVMIEGDAKSRIFTFPIPTYNITKDFDWDNPSYNKLWEMTAKFGIPYFSNFIHSDMKPEDARSMCCRLRLNQKELRKRGGGLFGAHPLTGSIGVVTINMPQLGYLSKDETEFFEKLEEVMKIAKDSLEIKRKILEEFTNLGLYPYSKFYLKSIKEAYGKYWKNHFLTIGINGLNEALLNLLNTNIASEEGKKFAIKTLNFMRDIISNYQEETGNLYNLEATPAEGCGTRFGKIDKKLYPKIIVANEEAWREKKASPYYTNSSQLSVGHTDDIFEALTLQDEIQTKYTGGCIEKGNKVLTDKGLLNIEYIVKNFKKLKPIKAISYNPEKKISEWDEITDAVAIDVQKKNKIRIKAEKNLDIVTSDWHPFFLLEKIKVNPHCPLCGKKVKNAKAFSTHLRFHPECRKEYKIIPKYEIIEKRADELKIKEYILQNSHNLYSEQETELNDDLMWLIGFFISDGCISGWIDNRGGNNLKKYKVRFATEHARVLLKTKIILSKYFNTEVKILKNDKRSEKLKELTTSKKDVADFLFKYGFKAGKKVYDINIPKKVKENITKTNLFSLLAGLIDGDGHISKREGVIEYYTVSCRLAEDILEICTQGGLMISKHEKPTKRENEVNGYRLRIPAYQATKIKNKLTISINSVKINKTLSNRKKRHFPVVRVKKLSKVDVEDNNFYDLTTKKNHNYLAGKDTFVFIHNTVIHGFLGEKVSSPETVKLLVKKIAHNFKLPYYTLTPTFSVCPIHGYLKGEHEYCPKCDEEIGYKNGGEEKWEKKEQNVKSTAESSDIYDQYNNGTTESEKSLATE